MPGSQARGELAARFEPFPARTGELGRRCRTKSSRRSCTDLETTGLLHQPERRAGQAVPARDSSTLNIWTPEPR